MSEHHDDDHHHSAIPDKIHSSREELDQLHIPMMWRDECVDYLALLRKCRAKEGSFPGSCHNEKHGYEHCLWDLHQKNVKEMAHAAPKHDEHHH